MKLLIMGPPGSGKGTASEIIEKGFNLEHISTGDIFRKHMRDKDELGLKIQAGMDAGQFVSDEITNQIIQERIKDSDSFLLDGYPRDLNQANFLFSIKHIDGIIHIDLEEDKIITRLSLRRVCSTCGASYHLKTKRPINENICDKCNSSIVQRKDDQPEIIKSRLETYTKKTQPILDFFKEKNVPILDIDGDYDLSTDGPKIIKQVKDWQESLNN